ncbi:MAG: riboflavin synthase [Planctomycetota bacterium]|jgi:riboflavin synthase
MFTGIVERVGEVRAVEPAGEMVRLSIDLGPLAEAAVGDSIAVAGVCLTLAAEAEDGVGPFDVVRETLDLTSLGRLEAGSRVNLEGALRVGDRLGGHFVQGHVDGRGTVRSLSGEAGEVILSLAAPKVVVRDLIKKGSVTVDGVALTVVELDEEGFTVTLVPHTLDVTTLGELQPGDPVNLEADLLGKWVRRLVGEVVADLGADPSAVATLTRERLESEGVA